MTTTGSWRPTALPWRSRARRPCGRSNLDPLAQGAQVGLTLDHGRAESPQVLNRTYGPQANQSRNGFPQTSIGQIPLQLASLQRDIGRATAGTSTRSQEVDAGQQTVIRRFSAKRPAVRLFDVRSLATAFRCQGQSKKPASSSRRYFFAPSTSMSRPRPGASNKSTIEFFTICLGNPMTMSVHHGSEALGYSKAI